MRLVREHLQHPGVYAASLVCWTLVAYRAGPLVMYAYMTGLNLAYFCGVFPDHDTFESNVEHRYEGVDWLRVQICNSGNFMTASPLWYRVLGGINFQIEHHLFPSVSHLYYPRIAPIVKAYCFRYQIPYTDHPTLWSAFTSYQKMLEARGRHAAVG